MLIAMQLWSLGTDLLHLQCLMVVGRLQVWIEMVFVPHAIQSPMMEFGRCISIYSGPTLHQRLGTFAAGTQLYICDTQQRYLVARTDCHLANPAPYEWVDLDSLSRVPIPTLTPER